MPDVLAPARVMKYSAANAWSDMWVMYTPTTWLFGWLSRVLMQVAFFAIIGLLLESPDAVRYLFIGNAVAITVMEVLTCIGSSTWERRQGTLPLLVAAPQQLWPVFVGRSVQWLPSGVLTASVALFALGPLAGVTWTFGKALLTIACLVVVAVSTYCLGLALAVLVLPAMNLRHVVSHVTFTLMILVCGVMVPVSFWPGWVQALAQAVPLTHGLAAVRRLADAPAGEAVAWPVAQSLVLAIAVGGCWLLAMILFLERLVAVGRRSGSIELSD